MNSIRLADGATVYSPSLAHILAVAQREIDRLAAMNAKMAKHNDPLTESAIGHHAEP